MCKFCRTLESRKGSDAFLKKSHPYRVITYGAAMRVRQYNEVLEMELGSFVDPGPGEGYPLNFCPECGRKLKGNATPTNYDHLRTLEHYEMATAILNIGDEPCEVCPRDREDRCNDDCDNGLVEWLAAPYDPKDPVWTEH